MSDQVTLHSAGRWVDLTFDISEVDGTPVLFVDTEGCKEDSDGPILRIRLNDEAVYENPKYPMS